MASDCVVAGLAGTDADGILHRRHEDLAVADATGLGRVADRIDGLGDGRADIVVTLGSPYTQILADGWTAVSVDGSRAAHWEHTVAITEAGPQVLTRG